MKKLFIFLVACIMLYPVFSYSQGGLAHADIRSGFYIKAGPSFPLGTFKSGNIFAGNGTPGQESVFMASKTGPAMDLGFMIFIGPSFAKHFLRVGLDLTFLTINYQAAAVPDSLSGKDKWNMHYYFAGNKIGPMITINPIDRLMIDLSYKLNGYIAHCYDNEWGKSYTQNEVELSVRYRFLILSCQYNWGKTKFNIFDKDKPVYDLPTNTFRILFGFKI